jgi:hypothetical protein
VPDHISVSQITTYLACSRRYAYRYLEKARVERRALPLAFGRAVHEAVDWLLEARMGGEPPEERALVGRLDLAWSEALAPGGFEESLEEIARQHALARRLVVAFAETAPDLVPDDVEAEMVVDLVDPRTEAPLAVPLLGYADGIFGQTVMELKTASRKASPWKWRLQLAAYSLAFRKLRGTRPTMRVVQLVKTKEPAVVVDEVTVAERDEIRFREIAAEVVDAVRFGAFVANPPEEPQGAAGRPNRPAGGGVRHPCGGSARRGLRR